MDLWHKILTAIAIVLLIVAGILVFYWLEAHDAAIKAQAKIAADQASLEKLAETQKVLATQLDQIRSDQAKQVAAIGTSFQQAQSPTQLAALLTSILKQPVTVNVPPATAANPNPAPVIELPDAPKAKVYFQECETCKVNYAVAQKELTVAKSQDDLNKQRIDLITQERDTWKQVATGGSWIRRAGKRLEHFAIDTGIVVGILCGSGHCK